MKKMKFIFLAVLIVIISSSLSLMASHKGVYPVKRQHDGINIKPKEAYNIISKSPDSSFIVDVRSRYEYQDIGHPVAAYNIPVFFYATETGHKGYKMIPNDNFCSDLKARFRPEKDSLFMICRSGERSTTAAAEAMKCGFSKDRVYSILGGFEGDKIHEEDSPFSGKRMVGGWSLEGLPWTYKMKPDLMYLPDVQK